MKLNEFFTKFKDEETIIRYLITEFVLPAEKSCSKCKRLMRISYLEGVFRCSKCSRKRSIFKNTFFSGCKIKLKDLLIISYLYLIKTPISGILNATSQSSETISAWTKFLRQLLGDSLSQSSMKIGGPNVIVEIDETKMGKRKFNRGHGVEGVWVVAGIERTVEKKIFAVQVEDRKGNTIKQIIKKYVKEGSIIYTDCWKSYNFACNELDFEHKTVNHSLYYKDPITGVHTNTIEGLNNGLKTLIVPRNRVKKNMKHHLLYYIWRRQNKNDLWGGFITALKFIKYK